MLGFVTVWVVSSVVSSVVRIGAVADDAAAVSVEVWLREVCLVMISLAPRYFNLISNRCGLPVRIHAWPDTLPRPVLSTRTAARYDQPTCHRGMRAVYAFSTRPAL